MYKTDFNLRWIQIFDLCDARISKLTKELEKIKDMPSFNRCPYIDVNIMFCYDICPVKYFCKEFVNLEEELISHTKSLSLAEKSMYGIHGEVVDTILICHANMMKR